jgi:hypothetical protein
MVMSATTLSFNKSRIAYLLLPFRRYTRQIQANAIEDFSGWKVWEPRQNGCDQQHRSHNRLRMK